MDVQKIFASLRRKQKARERRAGPHECVPTEVGSLARVTGRGGVTLKRPVTTMRLYECRICGRTMSEPTKRKERR